MNKTSRAKIVGLMTVIMLILIITTGFFSIPIGISTCSIIGIIYGYNRKDKNFFKLSVFAFAIGVLSIIYTLFLIQSM